jgi:hypothetical protein
VLTTLGTLAQATVLASTTASVGMLTAEQLQKAELSNLHSNRAIAAQQQNNIQQARPKQQNRLSQNPVGVDNSDVTPWWHLGAIIRNVTEFTRVRRPDKDGYLTLGEAKWQWKHGGGTPVTVDVRTLDFSGLRVSDFPGGPGSLKLHTFQDWFDYIVHGTVTTELNADYTVSVLTDRFNFDIKPWLGNIKRNIYTILLRTYVGSGEPFPVSFEGSAPIAP